MSGRNGRRRLHPAARVAVVVVAVGIFVNLALSVLDATTRGADETAPQSSSFSTGHTGVAAWATLLRRNGHATTKLRGSVADSLLAPDATLVVLDPNAVDTKEQRAVRDFVHEGGRLVAGGQSAVTLLSAVLHRSPLWAPSGAKRAQARGTGDDLAGVRSIEGAGDGSWRSLGDTHEVLGDDHVTVASEADVGAGRVIALADPSPLQNRLLGKADNAAFALALAGDNGASVLFAEGEHGYGRASGLGAIPRRWQLALIGLLIAAVVVMVAAGRRLGPAEDDARALPPPRRVYVDAVATSLARTHRPSEALAPLQAAARSRLARRAGLPPDADDSRLRTAAARLGFPPDETEALLRPPGNDGDVLAAGRALARITGGDGA